jgi:hypothetical protein
MRSANTAGVATALSLLFAGAVQAATVDVLNGPVSLNQGNGFRSISSSASAAGGDLVMAGAGGQAEITYDDGCKQTVNSGETVSVGEVSPCKLGVLGDPMTVLVVGSLGVAAVVGLVTAVTDNGPSSP